MSRYLSYEDARPLIAVHWRWLDDAVPEAQHGKQYRSAPLKEIVCVARRCPVRVYTSLGRAGTIEEVEPLPHQTASRGLMNLYVVQHDVQCTRSRLLVEGLVRRDEASAGTVRTESHQFSLQRDITDGTVLYGRTTHREAVNRIPFNDANEAYFLREPVLSEQQVSSTSGQKDTVNSAEQLEAVLHEWQTVVGAYLRSADAA